MDIKLDYRREKKYLVPNLDLGGEPEYQSLY